MGGFTRTCLFTPFFGAFIAIPELYLAEFSMRNLSLGIQAFHVL